MERTRSQSVWYGGQLFVVALIAGGLSYWAAGRTPMRPLPGRLEATAGSFNALLALFALALATAGAAQVLIALRGDSPTWAQRYASVAARYPWRLAILPIALAASYLATRISLSSNPHANYWPALGLWLGALSLLLVAFVPASALVAARTARPSLVLPRINWRVLLGSEAAVIAFVAAVALMLRLINLSGAPFLVHGDEEQMGTEALHVTGGAIKDMFTTGWAGIPTMVFFIQAGAIKLLGGDIVTLRILSALVGSAAVVITYLLLRDMFGRGQALTGAIFMAAYHFHLHFSRLGLVNIWDSLAAALAMFFAYRASRDQRTFDFVCTGLVCALALYVYTSTRAATVVVIAYFAYVSVFNRSFLRQNAGRIALAVLAFGLTAMPLGAYFLIHHTEFTGRLSDVGLFQSGWYDQQVDLGRSPASIVWYQVRHAFGGLVHYPISGNVNLYDKPHTVISGWSVVPFVLGGVYALFHLHKKEHALLLIGLVVPVFLGGVLTVPPTAWQRLLVAIPSISGLVAVGLWQVGERLFFWRRAAVPVFCALGISFLAAQNAHLYFDAATTNAAVGAPIRYETTRYVSTLPKDTRVYWFGAPDVWTDFVAFELQDRHLIEVFDPAPESLPPVERPSPAAFLFMPQRENELYPLALMCPGGNTKDFLFHGAKVLAVYELPADNTCAPQLEPPPANDHFANATPVMGLPFNDTLSTKAATLDPSEPQPGPAQPGNQMPCGGVNNTAWYRFAPDTETDVVAEAAGSDADTLVAVYQGTALGSLTPVMCSSHLKDHRAEVRFRAHAGTTYNIQVAALSYAKGTVTLNLSAAAGAAGAP